VTRKNITDLDINLKFSHQNEWNFRIYWDFKSSKFK